MSMKAILVTAASVLCVSSAFAMSRSQIVKHTGGPIPYSQLASMDKAGYNARSHKHGRATTSGAAVAANTSAAPATTAGADLTATPSPAPSSAASPDALAPTSVAPSLNPAPSGAVNPAPLPAPVPAPVPAPTLAPAGAGATTSGAPK